MFLIYRLSVFPRLNRRGHIEAYYSRYHHLLSQVNFRALTGAATLKLGYRARDDPYNLNFRALTGAATLKQHQLSAADRAAGISAP